MKAVETLFRLLVINKVANKKHHNPVLLPGD